RVSVTVSERVEDGRRRFDEGSFVHHIDLVPSRAGEKQEPVQVTVRGRVRGDVTVVGAEAGIRLDPFPADQGTRHDVTLEADRQDLDVKLEKWPPFMDV